METFRQILDLDEGDDHEFSLSMVEAYFSQADETFRNLDEGWCVVIFNYLFFSLRNFDAFLPFFLMSSKAKNLSELSTLGHFFKGSSAAFGLEKVQASCEKIQHYGLERDEEAGRDLKPEEALNKIKKQLAQLREEYAEAKQTLEDWFREHEDEDEDED